jgi:hypothetical protein
VASIAGLPPETLKEILEANGWNVIDETDHNWVLADSAKGEPIIIPKHCDEVSPEVMESVAHRTGGLAGAIHKAVQKHVGKTP